jgi:hypoxanthine phosphoribosyltransferase
MNRVNELSFPAKSRYSNLIFSDALPTPMSDLYISWEQYHRHIETLAVQIHQSQWQFNQIVCLAKGGLRVGDILCRLFRQPLAILFSASYSADRQQGEIQFSQHLAMLSDTLGDRILLVDDLVDSGVSLQQTLQWLVKHHGADPSNIRSAVLWYKGCSAIKPDYYVEYLPDNPWIHQPFEPYEMMTLAELAEKEQISSQESSS